jgi:hypothetical protein
MKQPSRYWCRAADRDQLAAMSGIARGKLHRAIKEKQEGRAES